AWGIGHWVRKILPSPQFLVPSIGKRSALTDAMLNHIKSKQFAPTSIKQPFVLISIRILT
ncbi:hypothetical protein, partial [Nostoc sp. CHAB 5715]|uniref:hypothetical protein n=1 Tax=Nostoc sp. CHAB 5715 TaxID=2780400 RepID=UPI001E617CB7